MAGPDARPTDVKADFSSATINKRATQGGFPRSSGKINIVTRANTGIGFECCAQLLDLGLGRLIMAVRVLREGEEAKQQLLSSKRNKSFALNPHPGHEKSIQVNYLGNALPFDEPQSFKFQDRYAASKVLGQLFLRQLAKRVPSSIVVINASNPGLCKSGLDRDFKGSVVGQAARFMQFFNAREASVGSRALVDTAVNHGPASHGHYTEDGKVAPMAPFVYQPQGEAIAKQLWQETMAELSFADVESIINRLGK
ncbi:hypothetical protein BJX68DRAFT_259843 [Aspergillus pseudodeflectus]|uniref:Uncharacterized protein n=1 Tax=Aspergillus pseudodeflectus TaxID=176178 RepID=A0ABR4J9B9_9EURO